MYPATPGEVCTYAVPAGVGEIAAGSQKGDAGGAAAIVGPTWWCEYAGTAGGGGGACECEDFERARRELECEDRALACE
jgi:hypothetical protein